MTLLAITTTVDFRGAGRRQIVQFSNDGCAELGGGTFSTSIKNGAKSMRDWSKIVWATVAFSFVAVAAGVVVAALPIDINMGGLGPHDHDGRQKRNRTGDEVGGKSHNCR